MTNQMIVQNIVNEILRECKKNDIDNVDEEYCSFYVQLLMLDPNWGISDQIMRIRSDVQRFIKFVVEHFKLSDHPSMKALKIQCYFDRHFEYLDESAKFHRADTGQRLSSLKVAILETDYKFDVDTFFTNLVKYIALVSGLGNPNEPTVYKEVEVALKSVITLDELKEFWSELYTVRMEKLSHLVKLVSGIRLYNKDCKRGGEGVPDLPSLLFDAIYAVKNKIQEIHDEITEFHLSRLTEVIRSCYWTSQLGDKVILNENIPSYASKSDLEYCKDLLLLYKIYQEKLRYLVDQTDKIKKAYEGIENKYNEILKFLHNKVIPNMHVQASSIFPIFESLFDKWSELQDKTVELTETKHLFDFLYVMMSRLDLENVLIKNYNEIRECTSESFTLQKFSQPIKEGIVILKTKYFSFWAKMKRKYEYEGHCCWALVTTKGFLVEGKEGYGIVKYKTKFYTFSSPNGFHSFIRDPEYYINNVLDLARKKCDLITYLRLNSQLVELRNTRKIVEEDRDYIEYSDAQIQADLQLERHYDFEYESNIWKLKERALKKADITRYQTTSTQTGNSPNIIPELTQTYSLKEISTQTMSKTYSNTPKPLSYFYGLRRKGDKQIQMNFTCDLGNLANCHN